MLVFLSAIVSWALKNRPIVLAATILFIVIGIRSALRLPMDAVPDVTNVQVQVITAAPALSPVEVEQYISVPVERAMAGIPRTTEVRPISKYGLSVVTIVFRDDTDIYFARQLVDERMREAESSVLPQYGKPEIGPVSSGLGEIYQFTVKNEALTLMQLEEILDWQIAPALRAVPGIVEVNSFGGEDRQYQVMLDPKRLQASGVSIAQVADALEKSNANAGGGYVNYNRQQFVVGTAGLVRNLADLQKVVIGATPQGIPITIATVGDVRYGARLRRGAATIDGQKEGVIGVAMMLLGENSRVVTQSVKDKLALIQPSLPHGTTIEPFYDRSILVDRTIKTVAKNLLEGALLVSAVLFLLLGDLRSGLVVAATIPLSLLFAIIAMNALGLSGNLMSLGAIDFGLLVDGAVIIVENSMRRLSERSKALGRQLTSDERSQTVETATVEVRSASVFGEAIIAIVYLPILALTSTEGKLFRPMATTVLLALAGAFVLSLTLVPVLTSYWVKPKSDHSETWLIRKASALYRPGLSAALRHRWLTVTAALAALAVGAVVFTRVGAEFIPQLDEGDLVVEARRLTGTSLEESVASGLRLERAIKATPEVSHVVTRTGAPEVATDPMGVEQSDVYVGLKPRSEWRKHLSKEKITEEISAAMEKRVPEISAAVSQPIQMRSNELIAGIRSDVAVLIYGPDLEQLRQLADRVSKLVEKISGAEDVRVEQSTGLSYIRIEPDRGKLARYGLTVADVNQAAETIAVGYHAGDVLEGERRFGIFVRTALEYAGDLDVLRSIPLHSLTGQIVPLGDVADIGELTGPAQVSRQNQSRRISVEFNVRGRDLLSVVREAQATIQGEIKPPTGYRVEWGGQFEHYQEAKSRLSVVVPLALALILFLLWLAFDSTRAALIVFLNVPFAMAGGAVALWARSIPFSISAGIGFIALFGVAVLNGLVLISFAHHLEEKGMSHSDAVREAADERLRPVLMTALVAALGFVPMALSSEPGSEVQRPLATVVIGGLISATLLTLFVLPVVYGWLGSTRAHRLLDHR